MFSSEAEAWQNSLHQFIGITERNLQQLEADRGGASSGVANTTYQYNANAGGRENAGKTANMSTRNVDSAPSHSENSINASNNNNNNNNSSNNDIGNNSNSNKQTIESNLFFTERDGSKKYDFLFKKNKYLQEKIKRLEDVNAELATQAKENNEAIQQMGQAQKQDKQMIITLTNEFKQMKAQTDASKNSISSQYRDKTSNYASLSIIPEDDIMYDRVMARIEHEVKRSLTDYENQYARERAEFCKNLAEKSLIECKAVYQNSSVSHAQLRDMEKEAIKMRTDVDRLKLKQGIMEQSVTEIKDSMVTREREAEERHRKALSGYKIDMNNTMDSLSRKVNDTLASIQSNLRISEIPAIWKSVEDISHNYKAMSRENANRLASIEGKCNEVDARVKYFASPDFVQDIFDGNVQNNFGKENTARGLSNSATMVGRLNGSKGGLTAFANWKSFVESKLNGVESHLDRFKESHDKVLKASSLALLDCEKRLVDLANQVQSLEDDTEDTVNKLVDAGKNTRKRVQEMGQKLESIASSKAALDELIQVVDARAQDDASWSYNFNSTLEEVNKRLQYLETLPSISATRSQQISQGQSFSSINKEEILASIDVKLKKYVADVEGLQIHMRRYVDDARSQTTSDVDLKTSVYDESIRALQGKLAQMEKSLDLGMRSLRDENHNVYNELERLETSLSSSHNSRSPEVASGNYTVSPNTNYRQIHSAKPNTNENVNSLTRDYLQNLTSSQFSLQVESNSKPTSKAVTPSNSLRSSVAGVDKHLRRQHRDDVSSSGGSDDRGEDDAVVASSRQLGSHDVDEEDSKEFKAISNIMMTKKKFRDQRFGRN